MLLLLNYIILIYIIKGGVGSVNKKHMGLHELIEKHDDIRILWTGNDGWLISADNNLIAIDLDLFNHERITPCNVDIKLLAEKLYMHFITHEHEDHFSSQTCKYLYENGNCTFVIPKSCEQKAKDLGMKADRILIVSPNEVLRKGEIKAECIRAVHGHIDGAVYSGASLDDCGYIINILGKRIYQPGDTVLLEEHSQITDIDILFVSPTDHNTKIDNSIKIIKAINPKYIFPQHHSTYIESSDNIFWTHGYVDELYETLDTSLKNRFIKLEQGEVCILDFTAL